MTERESIQPLLSDLEPITIIESDPQLLPDVQSWKQRAVVDVGCGMGNMVAWFVSQGGHAVGVDTAERVARARARHPECAASFVEGDATHLPLESASADMILFLASLHHIPESNMAKAMQEAVRVLKPGGQLVIVEPVAAPGAYTSLTHMVEDETQVLKAAKAVVDQFDRFGLELSAESHLAMKRRLADFRALLDEYVNDPLECEACRKRAESMTNALAAAEGTEPEQFTFLSICRRTVLTRTARRPEMNGGLKNQPGR